MTRRRRLLSFVALTPVIALSACRDGLMHPAAPAAPASVSIRPSFQAAGAGVAEAFDRADQLSVRFLGDGETRFEADLPFSSSGGDVVVSLQVPLRAVSEQLTLELELRAERQALFRGSGPVRLTAGVPTTIDLPLLPVAAGIHCAGETVVLSSYGEAVTLIAAVVFATGDTIPDAPVDWSTADDDVVTVSPDGTVSAVQDGDALVVCSSAGFSDSRTVRVFAVVADIEIAPADPTVMVGSSIAFTATLRDARGNPITAERTISWESSATAVATIDADGIATAIAAGSTTITAASGDASGATTLTAIFLVPDVTTGAASAVQPNGAVLNGTVNPQGAPTQTWFEWGADPALATFTSTVAQSAGSGMEDVAVSVALADLLPNVTYYFRIAASSAGGGARGEIRSFTTPPPPPSVETGRAIIDGEFVALLGFVNPNGSATQAWFEFGTTPDPAGFTRSVGEPVGSGTNEIEFMQLLEDLLPGTAYFARIAASNAGGEVQGDVIAFTTAGGPPIVEAISGSLGFTNDGVQAQFRGSVVPNGAATTAWFEWTGDDTSETDFEASPPQEVGAGFGEILLDHSLLLDPDAPRVFFRVAATNQLGTTRTAWVLATFPVE